MSNLRVRDQCEGSVFVAAIGLKLSARELARGNQAGRLVPLPHEPKRLPQLTALNPAPDQIGFGGLPIPAVAKIPFRAL
jgi:hypothetical protein